MRLHQRALHLRALLLLLLLSAAPLSALAHGTVARGAPEPDPVAAAAPLATPADPSGAGPWARGACLLCAASFVMVGGTSILGLAAAALALPEFAAACGATCAYAFG
jgi:hypothetical protein